MNEPAKQVIYGCVNNVMKLKPKPCERKLYANTLMHNL